MIETKHRTLSSVYLVNDAVASNLAMLCAWALRVRFEVMPVVKGPQELSTYVMLLPIVTLVFPLAFAVQGLYRIRPTRSKAEEWLSVAVGSVVATIILSGLLLTQAARIAATYARAGMALRQRIERGEWATLILERS